MVNLSFDVTDEFLVYGMDSEGFKSGGFTQRVLPPLVPGSAEPELASPKGPRPKNKELRCRIT